MPPRRTRGPAPIRRTGARFVLDGDEIPLVNGVPQFASRAVYDQYRTFFTNAPVHRACGLDLDNCGPELFDLVEQYHWVDVVAPPGRVNVDLVREFYAYLRVHPHSNVVHVRGKPVVISPAGINEYFNLVAPDDDHEYTVMFNGSDAWLEEVGAYFGIQWTMGPDARTFEEYEFRRWEDKCLHRLVRSNLIPANHKSTVYYSHATLMYWLWMGWPVNVGALIHSEMTADAAKPRHTLPYGSLITAFCEAAECPILGDSFVNPKPILSLATVAQIPGHAQAQADDQYDDEEQDPYNDFGHDNSEAGPSHHPSSSSYAPDVDPYDPENPGIDGYAPFTPDDDDYYWD